MLSKESARIKQLPKVYFGKKQGYRRFCFWVFHNNGELQFFFPSALESKIVDEDELSARVLEQR